MMNPDKISRGKSKSTEPYHTPVLLHTVLNLLITRKNGIYVDLTFGGGGHASEILKTLDANGKLFAFDQDSDAMENIPNAEYKFLKDARFTFLASEFRFFRHHLHFHGIQQVDGILADLGTSSAQLNRNERGFSYFSDYPLDMRMNQKQTLTAMHVLNEYPQEKLRWIFKTYGELNQSALLAEKVVQRRKAKPFQTCRDLAQWAIQFFPKNKKEKFLSCLFQSIRIEVNDELNSLREMLHHAEQVLKKGGRLAVISYHSLEDRMIKNFMKTGNTEGIKTYHPISGLSSENVWKIITPKPICPDENEIRTNPRSRSAKLRVAEKL